MASALLDRMSKLFTAVPVLAALPGTWVVGGAVRDLLLDLSPGDFDVVVEGDAIAVARRAASELGGEAVVHERFGTARVRAGDLVFDVTGARRETYARPGALPDVELGATLADDLARRDFTVNTLALRLSDGELAGWPGAQDDLRARVLRVLHGASFADDPTRLIRLARYAGRLGFAAEPQTAQLAVAAVAGGALEAVTGERLGAELRLLAREPQPASLLALEAFGLGAALLPAFEVDAALVERAVAMCAEAASGGEVADAAPRRDLVALACGVRGADPRELAARLRALAFPAADAVAIVAAAGVDAAALADARPSEADAMLARLPPEAAAVAAGVGAEPARAWLLRDRHLRLAIGGDDLLAAGLSGPAVGRGLAAARAALLDGVASDGGAQLAAAVAGAGEGQRRQ